MKKVTEIKDMPTESHFAILEFIPNCGDGHFSSRSYSVYDDEQEWMDQIKVMVSSGTEIRAFEAFVPKITITTIRAERTLKDRV